jgi:hypothetical protein
MCTTQMATAEELARLQAEKERLRSLNESIQQNLDRVGEQVDFNT